MISMRVCLRCFFPYRKGASAGRVPAARFLYLSSDAYVGARPNNFRKGIIIMNDAYVEWLVKRKTPGYVFLVKGLLIFLCIFAFFLSAMIPFGFVILLLAIGAAYFIFPMLSVEYEYLVVNDQMSIDKIMGQKRRKRVWEGSLEQVEILAPLDSYLLKDAEKKDMKALDFSSRQPGAKVYGMICQTGGVSTKLLLEPNEKILNHLWQRAPRKVVK